jgi:heptosyltransferase-2
MQRPIPLDSIKSILVTRTDRIGDVVLSTPVLEALRKRFPNVKIVAMVLPTTRAVVEGNPYVDEVLVYDKRGSQRRFLDSLRFALSLRKKKIDVALHLHPTNRMHILSRLAGIPFRIGYKKKFGWLLSHTIAESKHLGTRHEAEYNFDLLRFLDVPKPDVLRPLFVVERSDETKLDQLLAAMKLSLPRPIVFFPSASCVSKKWPLEHFASLAEILYARTGVPIVLVGGPDAVPLSALLRSSTTVNLVDLVDKLDLKMLGALFKRARLVVSNDSGPMHIAASVGAPVVSIFGRNDPGLRPQRWRALGKKSFYIHKDVGCIKCLAHNCQRDLLCLKSISVNDVMDIIDRNALI